MFTYDQIIEINRDYSPYYDLLSEGEDTWKGFIVTPQFYDLLNKTLDCLEKENISLWLQGAYGTGKSHATGFLKHLLWLPMADIEDNINGFNDAQAKHRLLEYRKRNRVFPVVMYGSDKITNQIDFGLQLEIGVRRALKKHGYEPSTKTDFEAYADAIEEDVSNYWDKMIETEHEISELVQNKKQMVTKLKAYDQDLFITIRNVLNKRRRSISVPDIVQWLTDVCEYIREEGIATHMVIYWDEFTTILDKRNSEIHEYIQRIAEASHSSSVFLYLISHRTIAQGSSRDDRNKLLGRFNDTNYEMSSITTYLLMSNSIRKKNYDAWEKYRELYSKDLDCVIDQIANTDDNSDPGSLRNLFPIHPYTANIATYIARVMGSTERSIFNFLNDDNTGFKYFISKFPGKGDCNILTVDYVFDFFRPVFEDQNESFMVSVIQKLHYSESALRKENANYLPLFKALLIMNIAHRRINLNSDNNDIVIPDEDNLYLAMKGSHLIPYIPGFLEFIDQKKMLIKDHAERYIVEAATFDSSAINEWILKNKNRYAIITEILSSENQKSLFLPLLSNHKRHDVVNCRLADAANTEHQIKMLIGTRFKQDFKLRFIIFVAHNYTQLSEIHNKVSKLVHEVEQGICFIVVDTLFTDDSLDMFLTFKAQIELAHSKHEDEASAAAQKNLQGFLKQWITEAAFIGFATWYILDKDKNLHSEKCGYRELSQAIDGKIAPIVFYKSFDVMVNYVNIATAWDIKMAKKAAELFLTSSNYQDLSIKTKSGPLRSAAEILLDKNGAPLVNDELKIVSQPQEHPLIILIRRVSATFKSNDEINLADDLAPLFKPPFGYYKNHVFLAALSFAFRKYIGKLYSPLTGEKLNEIAILDIIENLFKYHNDNKNLVKNVLLVRIGSEKEATLVKIIEGVFELEDCNSIVDARYKLAEKLKQNVKVPLWLLRYSPDIDDDLKVCIQIIADRILPISSGISSIPPKEFENIANDLSPYKNALHKVFENIDNEMRRKLFVEFGIENEGVQYQKLLKSNLDSLIEYLKQNLQGDPVYWDEDKMVISYKDWLLSQMNPKPISYPPENDIDGDSPSEGTGTPSNLPSSSEIWNLVQDHQDEMWDILKTLINEDGTIRSIIYDRLKEYLE